MTSKHAMIGTDKDNSEVFFGKEYLIINLVIILIYLNYYCHFFKNLKLIFILFLPYTIAGAHLVRISILHIFM